MRRVLEGFGLARKALLGGELLLRAAILGVVVLLLCQLLLAAIGGGRARADTLHALRIWPAVDYTRVTLESRTPIRHELLMVKNPDRLVLDLIDVDTSSVQKELSGKLQPNDPYLSNIRAARFKPNVTRIVLDLNAEVKPQIFTLPPVGDYGHRLVLDIYPLNAPDPLRALLEPRASTTAQSNAPTTAPPVRPTSEQPLPERPNATNNPLAGMSGSLGSGPSAPPSPSSSTARDDARPPNNSVAALPTPGNAPLPDATPEKKSTTANKPTDKAIVDRLITIAIDPGHGGEDPGALGKRGSQEKQVTLAIARRLKSVIDAEPNMRAVLTRDGDYFVSLGARVEKARRVRADLFVSVHADAFIRPDARGSSVFALSERGATSTAARWLAKRENEADLIGGVNLDVKDRFLAQTLLDLSQTATIQDSLKLGHSVLGELGSINTLHKPRVEQAGFAVLKAPDIPSILVETAFISNPSEEKRLSDEGYQEKMAQAILKGIKRYFAKNPPLARSTIAAVDR